MTSPLDEVSFQLGQINAGLAILNQRDEKRSRQMDQLQTSVGEIKTRLKPLTDDVKFMKPHVQHYKGVRGKIAWVGSSVLTIAGLVGGAASEWFFKKFTE